MDNPVREVVAKALDAESFRHQIISLNVANANNANFRPLTVDFESLLGDVSAVSNRYKDNPSGLNKALQRLDETSYVSPSFESDTVQLDIEMTNMVASNIRYQTLVNALDKLGSFNKTAINGGSR